MRSKLIRDQGSVRTFVIVLDPGEEVVACLRTFATEENLIAAQVTAIGALSDVVLGFFDPEAKAYHAIPVREQVEVLSLLGNVAQHRGKPKVHAHIVVGKRDGTALGGHLVEAHVRPTLEVVVEEAPHHLRRETDEATGLALLTAE
jgi:predicted DNA-binding protein with PD1-like motif